MSLPMNMMKIDFYFDFLSPYSYLAYRIARDHFPSPQSILIPALPHIIAKLGTFHLRALKPALDTSKGFGKVSSILRPDLSGF